MKLAVLADVHGNLPALEAVLADVEQCGVDGVIVAGDLTTGGPHSVETIRLLRERGSWMIQGNGEQGILCYHAGDVPAHWRTSRQYTLLRWSYRRLDRETLDFIASLPEQRVIDLPDTAPIRVVHGSPRSPSEGLFPDRDPEMLRICEREMLLPEDREAIRLSPALKGIDEPVLACGHTHLPWQQVEDGRLVFNPGAVCGSLNGDMRAWYALLTWQDDYWQVEHRPVPYDLARIQADFAESGLLEQGGAMARALLLSILTGCNVAMRFLRYFYRLAAEAGFADGDAIPDGIWGHAAATFDWDGATHGISISNP